MNAETAKACLEFLMRTTLQGREAMVFVKVVAEVESLAQLPADQSSAVVTEEA